MRSEALRGGDEVHGDDEQHSGLVLCAVAECSARRRGAVEKKEKECGEGEKLSPHPYLSAREANRAGLTAHVRGNCPQMKPHPRSAARLIAG